MVSSGHIALFDVYWSAEDEKELTLNPCPPTVAHGSGEDVRTPSSIDIEETVIHIPNTALVTLSESNYPRSDYSDVWDADDLEDRDTNDDGVGDGVGDRKVWVLPACPDGAPANNGLCLGFSADLLNPKDWDDPDTTAVGDGKVQFHIDHVHQLDTGGQGRRYVLAYRALGSGPGARYAQVINSSNANHGALEVRPGEYEHPIWFFTRTGRYEFQMHVTGHPESHPTGGRSAVSPDAAVSSDVREYIVHVGLMADLSVTTTMTPAYPAPGDNVTITVTASSAGPDEATNTKVDVNLPDGLTYSSDVAATDTSYDSAAGVWTIGDLAKDASKTLTVTATAAEGFSGQQQTVKANIYATESADSVHALELDPNTENNMDDASVLVTGIPNVDPVFGVRCIIDHGLAVNADVCTEIVVFDSDSADTFGNSDAEVRNLETALSGTHSEYFKTFVDTNRDLGIKVKKVGYPRQSIILDLKVKDGKDAHSNHNSEDDDLIKVIIVVRGGDDYFAN